uniref:Uncharacterized protein n=1 Tax=Anguilla anguilla TaxID=7936 RepID=A0A0E9VIY1_ANGAN
MQRKHTPNYYKTTRTLQLLEHSCLHFFVTTSTV